MNIHLQQPSTINDDENIMSMINTESDYQEDPVKQDFLSYGYLNHLLIQSGTELMKHNCSDKFYFQIMKIH